MKGAVVPNPCLRRSAPGAKQAFVNVRTDRHDQAPVESNCTVARMGPDPGAFGRIDASIKIALTRPKRS